MNLNCKFSSISVIFSNREILFRRTFTGEIFGGGYLKPFTRNPKIPSVLIHVIDKEVVRDKKRASTLDLFYEILLHFQQIPITP